MIPFGVRKADQCDFYLYFDNRAFLGIDGYGFSNGKFGTLFLGHTV
jgi:hypothetical protein